MKLKKETTEFEGTPEEYESAHLNGLFEPLQAQKGITNGSDGGDGWTLVVRFLRTSSTSSITAFRVATRGRWSRRFSIQPSRGET